MVDDEYGWEGPAQKPVAGADDDFGWTDPAQPSKAAASLPAIRDIPAAAISGVSKAAAAAPGIIGSAIKGGEWLGDRARTGFTNLTGHDPAHGFEQTSKTPEQVDAMVRAERTAKRAARGEDENYVNLTGSKDYPGWLPTGGGMLEVSRRLDPDGPASYKPSSAPGRVTQEGSEFLAGMLGGKGLAGAAETRLSGLLPKIASSTKTQKATALGASAGAVAGTEFKDQLPTFAVPSFGVHPDEVAAAYPAVGGLAGGLAGAAIPGAARGVAGLTVPKPEKLYQDGLAAARQADRDAVAANPRHAPPLGPDEALALRQQGIDVPSYMLMGPNERAFVVQAAGTDPALRAQVRGMNDEIVAGREEPHAHVGRFIDDSFGSGGVDMQRAIPAVQEHVRQTNNANYTHVMDNLPHAQDVWSPTIERLYRDPMVRPYVEEAARQAGVRDSVSAPVWREAVEPQGARVQISAGNQWTHTPEIPGRPAGFYPDPAAPTNLRFHDIVQRLMRDDMEGGFKSGDTTRATALKEARRKLLGETDGMVEEYPKLARDPAHDVFGQRDMLAAGTEYLRRMDQFKQSDVRQAFNRATPEQQGLFQYGLAAELKAQYAAQPESVAKRVRTDRNKFDHVMGREWVDQFLAQHRMAQARAAATGVALPNIPTPSGWIDKAKHVGKAAMLGSPAPTLAALEAAGVTHVTPYLLAAAQHPASAAIAAVASPFVAGHFVRKGVRNERQAIADRMAVDNGSRTLPGFDPSVPAISPAQRKAGGEVGSRPGRKVNVDAAADALVKQVEQAREALSGETQNILAQPDTNVVRALSVAKNALG